jgi:lauroyl/myristoyl acyltransferase
LSHLNDSGLKKMITYRGLEIFEKGYQAGKGVVLVNSHFGWPSLALWLFVRNGYPDFYSILGERGNNTTKVSGIRKDSRPHFLNVSRESKSDSFRLLFQAREKLEAGGIVHVLGDGQHGRSHFSFPFLDKVRGFRASFAELGLITEAVIIPVFVLPDDNGRAIVEFHAPLYKGSEEDDHQIRLESLLRQYAGLLESKWKENPQFIHGGFIETHIRQVEAELLNEI